MSDLAYRRVLAHSQAKGPARYVLATLAWHVNEERGGVAWPSVATLAVECAMSERAVQRALAELEAAGEIVREPRAHRSSLYRVLPGVGAETVTPGVRNVAPPGQGVGDDIGTLGVTEVAPRSSSRKLQNPGNYLLTEVVTSPQSDDGSLPGMPDPPPRRNAGVLVAAWVRGYERRPERPRALRSQTQRVGRSAKTLLPDLQNDADWMGAERLAERCGEAGLYDLVTGITALSRGHSTRYAPGAILAETLAKEARGHKESWEILLEHYRPGGAS